MRRCGGIVVLAVALAAACSGGGGSVFETSGGLSTTALPGDASTTTVPGETTTTGVAAEVLGVVEVLAPDAAALVALPDGGLVAGDQLLVILAEGAGEAEAAGAAAAVGGEVVGRIEFINLWQLRIPATDAGGVQTAVEAAGAMVGVELAFPNGTAVPDEEVWEVPQSPLNDPTYSGGHGAGYRMIGVQDAWRFLRMSGLPSHPVHVGILDDGVWTGGGEFDGVTLNQPDPASGVLRSPAQQYQRQADGSWVVVGPDPRGSHGTGVANLVGADPDDGGVAGIAGILDDLTISTTDIFSFPYGSSLEMVPPNVADDAQVSIGRLSFTTGNMRAIVDQVRAGARVINLSWGCTDCSALTTEAYRRFFAQMAERHPKVLFVTAAGNNGKSVDGSRRYPSGLNLPNMITVGDVLDDGTTDPLSNLASSNYEVTLAAPGKEAVQAVTADGTIIEGLGGTSMPAPQVTAAAALLLSINPDLTAAQLKELLVETAATVCQGSGKPIDTEVGGRVLALDRAVHRVIEDQGIDLPDPLEFDLWDILAVAVSGDPGQWTVQGHPGACRPDCTDVTIRVSADVAIGGDTTQHLNTPGTVAWTVSVYHYPATLLVARTDNSSASLITLKEPTIDGHYTGTLTVEWVTCPPDPLGRPLVGTTWDFDLELTTDAADGGAGVYTGYFQGEALFTGPLTWDGTQLGMAIDDGEEYDGFSGAVARTDDTLTISGTWSGRNETAGVSSGGVWEVTRVG